MAQEIRIEKVVTDGFEMKYFKFGRGAGTLVIIPGLSVKSVMNAAEGIAAEYRNLTDDFTIYVLDRREKFPGRYLIHDMAEDTVKVLQVLKLSGICLLGVSQGGMISMDIAINHPDMVKKMVLGSTSAHVRPEQLNTIEKWIQYAKNGDRLGLFLSFGESLYTKEVFEQYREYFSETSKTVTDDELDKFITGAESIRHFDVSDRLNEIKCPVFAIGDFDDAVLDCDPTMEIAEKLDYRPDFKLYMYIGHGHAVYDTAPDYLDRVKNFLLSLCKTV